MNKKPCCNHNCRQGRDCPNRPAPGFNWELLRVLGAVALFWAVLLTAIVKGCAS
jgi:hypothetical protein